MNLRLIQCYISRLLILYFSFCCVFYICPINGQVQDNNQLQIMLEETQKYCENVKNIALHYICKERITDKENMLSKRRGGVSGILREKKFFTVTSVKRNSYLYDYQLIRKEDVLQEQRVLLNENGKKKNKKNADLSEKLKYNSQYLVFGPVGFLSQYWQKFFSFTIIGTENIDGETCFVLNAAPTQKREENYNFGRIWINSNNQIVRLEWEPISIQNYKDEKIQTHIRGMRPNTRPDTIEFDKKVVWMVDYRIEKNGVRFPSRQIIKEMYVFDSDTQGVEYETIKRETVFDYIDYKFFVVDTKVEY